MQELVRQKNMVEVKLSQQLQETKKELDKEKENYRAEMQEREARERALELSKRQLEEQLTAMDRENYESLQELNLLQERLQERIRVEGELREEKNKLLNVIKEKDAELAKERGELTERLQQHEQVIEVNTSFCMYYSLGVCGVWYEQKKIVKNYMKVLKFFRNLTESLMCFPNLQRVLDS